MSLKKGGGGMKNTMGGGVDQIALLENLEATIGCGPVETAGIMGTTYDTYKFWKSGKRNMTGPTIKLAYILIDIAGTTVGESYNV